MAGLFYVYPALTGCKTPLIEVSLYSSDVSTSKSGDLNGSTTFDSVAGANASRMKGKTPENCEKLKGRLSKQAKNKFLAAHFRGVIDYEEDRDSKISAQIHTSI